MRHLVSPDPDQRHQRGSIAAFEVGNPPIERPARIQNEVQSAKDDSTDPAHGKSQENRVDQRMDPARRVTEIGLVNGHPVVLQKPVSHQMSDQPAFERSEHGFCGVSDIGAFAPPKTPPSQTV